MEREVWRFLSTRAPYSRLTQYIISLKISFMQKSFAWKSVEYHSRENCTVRTQGELLEIYSEVEGTYEGKSLGFTYLIRVNNLWETLYCSLTAAIDEEIFRYDLEQTISRRWTLNGAYRPEFDGCTEVDIPLTPFTNTLPINRLHLSLLQETQIKVVYIDVMAQKLKPVRQKYKKLSETLYHYENVPNDFEADIKVDKEGFVLDYPELFVRVS